MIFAAMARVLRIYGAFLAGFFLLSGATHASEAGNKQKDERIPRLLGITTQDGERARITVSSGLKLAPLGRLDREGFRLLALTTTALNEENPLTLQRANRLMSARLLAGHEWHRNNGAYSLYFGPSIVSNDPASTAFIGRKPRRGGAMLADIWQNWAAGSHHPASYTQATLVIDQAQKSLFFKIKHGLHTGWRGVSIGPEVSVSLGQRVRQRGFTVQDEWRKLRLGLHISGLEITRWFVIGLAGGTEFATQGKRARYLTVTSLLRY